MTTIGETLRRERLKRNLDLGQISDELKISSRFLEAIEAEKFESLPGGVFTKSFVRQYAQLLGLDGEELADEVQRAMEPQPEPSQFADKLKPPASEFHWPRVAEWEMVGESRFRWSSSLSAAALVVVVMLVCSGVYAWWQRAPHPKPASGNVSPGVQTAQAPKTASPVIAPSRIASVPATGRNSANRPAAETATLPPRQPATAPPAPQPANTPAPRVPALPAARSTPPDPNAPVKVELTTDEPVWVTARTDGNYLFSGLMAGHQSRTVTAKATVELRLGNAGGATIKLNGRPVGELGAKGQVRTVQFTSGGFHIVPAKPSAPTPEPDRLDPR